MKTDRSGEITEEIQRRAQEVEVILMDVDGVLTAGMIVYDSNGVEIKHFNAHDGLGIKLAKLAGLFTGIISMRDSQTIRKRADEIGIDFLFLGRIDKLTAFKTLRNKLKLPPGKFCFIGDDLPDIPVLRQVGLAVAVKNAVDMVKENAHYITGKPGGEGAVREVIEMVLGAQNKLEESINKLWALNQ